MRPNGGTCQRWKASTLALLCVTVVFVKFTTASHSETKTDTNGDLQEEKCDESNTEDKWNGTMTQCELRQRLSTLTKSDLEGLMEYYKDENSASSKVEPKVNKEAVIWGLLVYGISKTAQRSLIRQVLNFVLKKNRDHGCYDTVGCFYPQNRMALALGGPVAPEEATVKFYYHTNSSPAGQEINADNWEQVTGLRDRPGNPLTVIFHGFKESRDTIQVVQLKDALLKNVACDVVVADWKNEAAFPYYGKAATNSPLVGALASVLLQAMYGKLSLKPEDVYLIGFSLGAHAAGFCGRHFHRGTGKKLGRISGLEPAGLLFENTNVSLSYEDADYVDVIHTNGGDITDLKFGTWKAVGHADFYVNGGSHQPGCPGGFSQISCSHNRAWYLYIESIESRSCLFKSIPCSGGSYSYEECLNRSSSVRAQMGFYSDTSKANGTYYLETNARPPYCIAKELPSSTTPSGTEDTTAKPPR